MPQHGYHNDIGIFWINSDFSDRPGVFKTNMRPGFTSITVKMMIDGDMTYEEKEKFVKEIEARCPISDNLSNTTPVKIEVAWSNLTALRFQTIFIGMIRADSDYLLSWDVLL